MGDVHPPGDAPGQRRGFHGRELGGVCGGGGRLVQRPARRQLVHLQVRKQFGRCGRVAGAAAVGFGGGLDRRVPPDGAKHAGKLGLFAVFGQPLALFRLDGRVVQVFIYALQAAELLHQRQRGLFADARHAGDVVGRIAHQALDFDELQRLHTVFFADRRRVHDKRLAVGREQHGRLVVHQLQAVAVAGRQQRRAARARAGGGQRAQDVVGLPPGLAHLHKAEVVQQLLDHRQLLGQFLRHAVAGGLVTVVGFVAESRRALVPGDGDGVGAVGGEQVEQNILEAEDRVGIPAVLGRQHADAEERAVQKAVAVQHQQFHGVGPPV